MIILDTDVFTILTRSAGRKQFPTLAARIEQHRESVYISAITVEEVLRGALALIRKEESKASGTEGYRLLVFLLEQLSQFQVVAYTDEADSLFRTYSPAVKRNGSADCKIAAIAHIKGAIVVTRNIRHFSQIPDIRFEDWTLATED